MKESIRETMELYNKYVTNVVVGAMQIADYLRTNLLAEAFEMIQNFAEGVVWLEEVNNKLKTLGYDLEFNVSSIHEFLEEINDGLMKQDYIVVADMFEYEIAPYFEQLDVYKVN